MELLRELIILNLVRSGASRASESYVFVVDELASCRSTPLAVFVSFPDEAKRPLVHLCPNHLCSGVTRYFGREGCFKCKQSYESIVFTRTRRTYAPINELPWVAERQLMVQIQSIKRDEGSDYLKPGERVFAGHTPADGSYQSFRYSLPDSPTFCTPARN
jgi:hypothetical protein